MNLFCQTITKGYFTNILVALTNNDLFVVNLVNFSLNGTIFQILPATVITWPTYNLK